MLQQGYIAPLIVTVEDLVKQPPPPSTPSHPVTVLKHFEGHTC